MATTPADPGTAPDPTPPDVGDIKRYPVGQPDGSTRQQLVLITSAPDESGAVRGRALCFEDETGQFRAGDFT